MGTEQQPKQINVNEPLPEGTEVVDTRVIKRGEIKTIFQDRRALKAPAPLWFIIAMNFIIEINTGAGALMASINGVSDHIRNTVIITLGIASFLCFRLKNVIGVVDTTS